MYLARKRLCCCWRINSNWSSPPKCMYSLHSVLGVMATVTDHRCPLLLTPHQNLKREEVALDWIVDNQRQTFHWNWGKVKTWKYMIEGAPEGGWGNFPVLEKGRSSDSSRFVSQELHRWDFQVSDGWTIYSSCYRYQISTHSCSGNSKPLIYYLLWLLGMWWLDRSWQELPHCFRPPPPCST